MSEPRTSSLFGATAVHLGYVSEDNVERVLEAQADARSTQHRGGGQRESEDRGDAGSEIERGRDVLK